MARGLYFEAPKSRFGVETNGTRMTSYHSSVVKDCRLSREYKREEKHRFDHSSTGVLDIHNRRIAEDNGPAVCWAVVRERQVCWSGCAVDPKGSKAQAGEQTPGQPKGRPHLTN